MTLSTENNEIIYTANGSNDTFAYNFKIFSQSDLKVYDSIKKMPVEEFRKVAEDSPVEYPKLETEIEFWINNVFNK